MFDSPIILALILVLNVAISFWNARVAGLIWPERGLHGTMIWLVVWSAVVQSAVGFSMPCVLALTWMAHAAGLLDNTAMRAVASLWYLAIIIPVLGTGLIITAHSWMVAYRERSLLNMGTAAYNTAATAHNLYSATSGIGDAFSSVGDLFSGSSSSSDSDDNPAAILVVILVFAIVAVSLGLGILATRAVVLHYAGRLEIPEGARPSLRPEAEPRRYRRG